MKKCILLSLPLVALFMTACGDDDGGSGTPTEPKGSAISFAVPFVDNSVTRGVTDNENFDYFKVWGFVDVPISQVFEGATVTKKDGKWEIDTEEYWFENHKYYFSAVGPQTAPNEMTFKPLYKNSSTGQYYGCGSIYYQADINNFQTDLVYAFVADPPVNQPVQLTFNHILSQIKLCFNNKVAENTQLHIYDISISKLPTGGQLDTNTPNMAWELNPDTIQSPLAMTVTNNPMRVYYEDNALTNYLYVMPADLAYSVTFTVEAYNVGVLLAGPYTHTITLPTTDLQMGRSYTYVADITGDNMTPKPLEPITFDVDSVAVWQPGGDIPTPLP